MQVVGIIGLAICAAVVYGVLHDQVTARICIEYFTIGHPRLIDSDSPTVLGLLAGNNSIVLLCGLISAGCFLLHSNMNQSGT